jgi:hypothetical protein
MSREKNTASEIPQHDMHRQEKDFSVQLANLKSVVIFLERIDM